MFEFEIVIDFSDGTPEEAAVLDALFQAGLDDTIVGVGRNDRTALGFTRHGHSLEQVVVDAMAQIFAAFPTTSVQIVDLNVLAQDSGKTEIIRRVREAAAQKANLGDSATASQDFLYGPDGLP